MFFDGVIEPTQGRVQSFLGPTPEPIPFNGRLGRHTIAFGREGGMLAFEIGAGQDKLVERLFKKAGDWVDVNTRDDGEAVRVFTARKA